jgi:hypothetical protein
MIIKESESKAGMTTNIRVRDSQTSELKISGIQANGATDTIIMCWIIIIPDTNWVFSGRSGYLVNIH